MDNTTFFIHSSADEHLGYFHFVAIMNNASTNIVHWFLYISFVAMNTVCISFILSSCVNVGVELLGYIVTVLLIF